MILKMPLVTHSGMLPHLMLLLLPVMTLFALPLATSLAVHVVMVEHKQRDELVVLAFLAKAMRAAKKAILLFGILITILYALCSFYLAPRGYVLSKQLFLSLARDQLVHVEPLKFHTPAPMLSFYVQAKEINPATSLPIFKKLILTVWPSKVERLFFAANTGYFDKECLVLCDGYAITFKGRDVHTVSFKQMAIQLDAYLQPLHDKSMFFSCKFLTLAELYNAYGLKADIRFEFHKRIAQTLWQLMLILLAFAYALVRKNSSFLHTIVACGSLFLATYFLIMLAQAYQHIVVVSLLLLYFPLSLAAGIIFWAIFGRRSLLCS